MAMLRRKLRRELWRLRGQALALGVIVASGIASFVTMRTGYDSLGASQARYYRDFRFADLFVSLKRAPLRVADEAAALPGVAAIEARVVAAVKLEIPGLGEGANGRIVSIPEHGEPGLNRLHLRAGRLPEPGRRDEVVLSEAFAEANGLAPGSRLGAILNGRWQALRVVGVGLSPEYVYEIQPGGLFPDRRRFGVLWMRYKAVAAAFDMDGACNDLVLALARGARRDAVIDALDRRLEPWGGLGAYGRDRQPSHAFLSNEIAELAAWGSFVPAIFLGVAAFLIHIVITRLVATQREVIAMLRAFGFGARAIGGHYLSLVSAMVGAGAVAGIALGLWLGSALTNQYRDFFHFPRLDYRAGPGIVLAALGVTALVAVAGSLSAVRRAVRLPPAEALRPEPPPVYHQGPLERLGLLGWLDPAARMALRHLERWPMRSLLSVVAIALAVGVVVTGRYFLDSMELIVDRQFRLVARESVSVALNEPRALAVRHELGHLPGVGRVEPFRALSVRLVRAGRSEHTAILGLEPGAELHRLIDRRERVVSLPPEGIVLTTWLGRRLAAAPGDLVRVECLEGRRRSFTVPVAALVDVVVGDAAYMDLATLGRLSGEPDTLSGAWLAADARDRLRLHATLRRMPAVASIALRERTIESFRDTIARAFGVFTTVMVMLASAIAVGVVYNNMRIALSERGRELASLRVLGFTRAEVARVLLLEQGLVTLCGIPLGCLTGFGIAALVSSSYDTELFRLPLVVRPASFAFATAVIAAAALASGLLVAARIRRLDLVAVLKTRE